MYTCTKHLVKEYALSAISGVTVEQLHVLDKLPCDGRAILLHVEAPSPGGMCRYGTEAVRRFAPRATIAAGTLVGEAEYHWMQRQFRSRGCDTR